MRFALVVVASLLLATACAPVSASSSGDGDMVEAAQRVLPDPHCSEQSALYVALDIPGPGMPTAEEAVMPFVGSFSVVTSQRSGKKAKVTVESGDGGFLRVFDLSRHDDGWWPDGYTDCHSETREP